MALQKSTTLANGAAGNYHRIISYEVDVDSNAVFIRVALYKDSAKRTEGSGLYFEKKTVTLTDEQFSTLPEDRTEIYTEMKRLAEYSGATDV